jgi:hypothetical protein
VTRWLSVWFRAVITPAWRRAAGVWIGAGIAGGIIFGPTGMHPSDLTQLAHGVPAVGAALAITWLLVFVPAARVIVRADGARFLLSLPHPRWSPRVVAAIALVALQLPWLLLWLVGDGVRGFAFVALFTFVIAALAAVQLRPRKVHFPPWTRPYPALRGVYLRALKRRAGDALVRGAGLALLAGLAAALIVRNNGLAGSSAAALGAGTIAIVLVPGFAGALMPLVEAQRSSAWLASSLGISEALRITVLAVVVVGVYVGATLLALVAATIAFAELLHDAASTATLVWLSATALASAIGMGLVTTRALVVAEHDTVTAPVRVTSGAVVASALAVVCVAWLGALGAGVMIIVGFFALLTARSR